MASVEDIASAMLEMLTEYAGKKNLKAMDLTKAMKQKFGEDEADKKQCKKAIRSIIDSGRCTYSYVGGSYIVLNPDYKEG